MAQDLTYNRQILWFGVDGQEKIENSYVAVIGIGGTGSHIIQELTYLGVKKFLLIDPDKVRPTNLNRLIGANKQDIDRLKVDIGERLIKFINEDAQVKTIADTFIGNDGVTSLKNVDFVFGCVDKDGARLLLTEYCKAYGKPFLDIATGILEGEWGGRVLFADKEEGCLMCSGELDQQEIRRDLSTADDRSVEDKIYGVDKAKLQGAGPSVISLNGILASLVVTEFLVHITGIRKIRRYFNYRGSMNAITHPTDKFVSDCYYCKVVAGSGDKADILRYARQGIDKILR